MIERGMKSDCVRMRFSLQRNPNEIEIKNAVSFCRRIEQMNDGVFFSVGFWFFSLLIVFGGSMSVSIVSEISFQFRWCSLSFDYIRRMFYSSFAYVHFVRVRTTMAERYVPSSKMSVSWEIAISLCIFNRFDTVCFKGL